MKLELELTPAAWREFRDLLGKVVGAEDQVLSQLLLGSPDAYGKTGFFYTILQRARTVSTEVLCEMMTIDGTLELLEGPENED